MRQHADGDTVALDAIGMGGQRSAVIGFADVVGYSTLMAADEQGTFTRWMTLLQTVIHPEVARHQGRIIDMAGDGILVCFADALPALAWARAVQNAVRARLDAAGLQEALPIVLRIGLHIGQVFETEHRIFGDAVNFAARLQAHAAPGGIVLSDAFRASLATVTSAPAMRDLGFVALKGFAKPARLFTIEADLVQIATPLLPMGGLPSIAVLPLHAASDEDEHALMADGIAEGITMSLASLRELQVISTASSAIFRGRTPDPREVGRVLGVRYVLLGHLRPIGKAFMVSMQLCETATGTVLWGDRQNIGMGDVFDLEDDAVRKIITGLAPQLRLAELGYALRRRPESHTAYHLLLRALQAMRSTDHETFLKARHLLQRAMEEEPRFSLPMAWAARWHSVRIGRGWSDDPQGDGQQAFILAEQAVAHDGRDALALATLGHINTMLRRDDDAAQAHFTQALAACPNHALAWTLSSGLESYLGRGQSAIQRAERGLSLSPQDPMRYSQYMFLAIGHYAAGDYAEALRWIRLSAADHPTHGATLMVLAAALTGLGRRDEARQIGAQFRALNKNFSLAIYAARRVPFRTASLRESFLEHLRIAQFPD